jgi:hypothetical protein
MSQRNYGDLVQAKAGQIAELLDQGVSDFAESALRECYLSMSAPEFNRLLKKTNELERDGEGYDLWIDRTKSGENPKLKDSYEVGVPYYEFIGPKRWRTGVRNGRLIREYYIP